MNNLIINPSTQKMIDSLLDKLPQSILLTGNIGVGLMSIAKEISKKHSIEPQVILPEKDDVIDTLKGIISVKMIRIIYDNTRSKIKNGRIIIIDCADRMTTQAQNAFLKLLEEPGQDTNFILLSHSCSKFLPTILSRVQKIRIKNILPEQTLKLVNQQNIKDSTKKTQIMFIADGLPAEIIRLSSDETYFSSRSSIIMDAKKLIQSNSYERLLILNRYKDDRELALKLLDDSLKILKISLVSNPKTEHIKLIEKILEANRMISANVSTKLVLTETFI
jgi:DNA polymerase III subunit delta'